jgi:3,4-dihydroxy 2-butanone 4-phosphate synthase/GTP cyclohydrolase II
MHAVDVLDNLVQGPYWHRFHDAMMMIAAAGRGAVVILRETRPTAVSDTVRKRLSSPRPPGNLRDYGIGAQILLDLGVKDMVLLSNTQRNIIGLEGYGLNVVEQRQIGNL